MDRLSFDAEHCMCRIGLSKAFLEEETEKLAKDKDIKKKLGIDIHQAVRPPHQAQTHAAPIPAQCLQSTQQI
jgi:hypothetical protein